MNAGFIGTGWAEKAQIRLFKKAGIQPQAICSGHPENARRVAKSFDIPEVYDSWQELLKKSSADLVSSVTPTALHASIVEAALDNGRHLISEAPFMNSAEVEALLEKAGKKPDARILIDYELRFDPRRVKIKEMLARRVIGKIERFTLSYEYDYATDADRPWNWENDRDQGGGMLNLVGGHLIDLSRWIFGAIEEVNASSFSIAHPERKVAGEGDKKRPVTAEDRVELELTFKNGVQGRIDVNAMAPDERGMGFLVEGSRGNLWLGPNEGLWKIEGRRRQEIEIPEVEGADSTPFHSGTYHLARRLKAFFSQENADDKNDFPSLKDALDNQRIIDRAYEVGEWQEVE